MREWILISVLGAASVIALMTWNTTKQLHSLVLYRLEMKQMQVHETSWRDANNLTHTVRTEREDGESDADFAARHRDAVEALKDLYPPA